MRQPRKLKDNATYHVTVRANRGEMVLFCTAMRILFLNVVKRAKKKYKFQIDNFSIMGNHVHLIIRPGKDESLSRIMQWVLSVFAMAWNRAHFQTGHVWGERFFSKIINNHVEFVKIFHYISQNPVKAQLVKSPEEWEFGGLWHFIARKKEIIGEPLSRLQELYRSYCRIFCPDVLK